MAPQRRTHKRPSLRWDGTLYNPQTFGEGPKAGTVDWVKQHRQRRAEKRALKRIFAERDAKLNKPPRWYLVSWPFMFLRAVARWVERRG